MRYLVTGAAGFIGSHLTEALLATGHQVCGLDNLSTGTRDNLSHLRDHPEFRMVLGSVLDDLLVDELVEHTDVIVHLAAAVGVRLIVEQPLRSLRTNIRGTENILDAAHRYRKKVLIASTSEIYGKNSGTLHETSERVLGPPSVARWAYSTSKAVDEVLALAFWRQHQIPTVIARFFNTVGPRQTGHYGMVIPRFVAQALLGRPITIYGDGSQTRCFCHVADTTRALQLLLQDDRAVGQIFNVGSTQEVSILDLAKRIIDATGSDSAVQHTPYTEVYGDQYEDMLRRVPDTTKLTALTGWKPAHDLDAILEQTIAWAKSAGPETLL